MASASPMAILALPDRAMPERPDGKPGEATDGRFAGLMAQFSQPQAAPSPVDPARGPTARVHRSMARKAAPATDALPASAEVGHRAAAAATPEAGLPGPTRTDPSVPKPPALEAKAAGPLATAPMVSAQDTSAAALKPATTPPAIEPRALAGEASPQGPATLPAVLLPPEAIPTPKAAPVEVPAVLAPTSGLAAAAAAGTTPTRGLPEPPSPPRAPQRPMAPPMSELSTGPTNTLPPAPNMAPPTAWTPVAPDAAPPLLEEQAPKTPAQPTDPALPQADLAGPGPVLQGTRRSGESAPGPVAKADPSPAGTKPAQDLQALAGPTPNGVAPTLRGILQRVTEAPTPSAAPTNAPPPALHPAAPSAQVLAAPDAIPTQQTATPSADTALLQGVPAQLGSSLTVSFGSEDPAPSPALQTTPSPDAGTGSKPLPPAALPQALAQLLAKAMSQPVVAEAEGMIRQATPATAPQPAPEVTVPNAPALIAPEAAPTQTSAAQPASPAPLQAVPAAPGASSLSSSPALQTPLPPDATPDSKPLVPAALPQALAQLLAETMSQPVAAGAEGMIRQATAPQPAPEGTASNSQAPIAPEAAPTQRSAAQPASPAPLQAVPIAPGASSLSSSPALQTPLPPDATPDSKPLVPAALPQALAQLLTETMSQPVAAGAEEMIRQATPASAPQPAPEVTAPNSQALIAPEAAPTQTSAAQPTSPAPLRVVPGAPGASSLKGSLSSSEDLVSSLTLQISSASAAATNSKPLAPAARPQKSTQLLAKAMSQPAAVEAEGTTRQGEPATAPQPGLDAAAPDVQALTTPNATPAPKSPTQSQGSDFLQAAFGEPGTSLGVTLGRRESLPGFIAKAVPSSAAEPTTGKPSAPAVLPQTLAQLPPKAALQPTADAQAGIQQALLKESGTLVGPEPVEPKPTLDLLPPANRTLDGTAFTLLGTASHAPEAPAASTPAAPVTPPAATPPPSAPVLQVAGGLRWMIKGGSQEAQLQLHPESLGQVTIHLKVEGGQVHAKVWISEAASMQAIKEGQPHLEQALKEQGLHLGSFDLQQGHRHFQEAPSAPMLREQGLNEALVARQEAPAPPPVAILNPHHVELYA